VRKAHIEVTECASCGQRALSRYCANCGHDQDPAPDSSGRRSPTRVLAAVWLGVSQAIMVGVLLVVVVGAVGLAEGFSPFSSTAGDPTFGFLSGITLRAAVPFLGLFVGGGVFLGIVVGSWKLWARRKHGWAVLVSSLPYLLLLVMVGSVMIWDSL
jgi:hypothetical protein